jgi:hypothetical protein
VAAKCLDGPVLVVEVQQVGVTTHPYSRTERVERCPDLLDVRHAAGFVGPMCCEVEPPLSAAVREGGVVSGSAIAPPRPIRLR